MTSLFFNPYVFGGGGTVSSITTSSPSVFGVTVSWTSTYSSSKTAQLVISTNSSGTPISIFQNVTMGLEHIHLKLV